MGRQAEAESSWSGQPGAPAIQGFLHHWCWVRASRPCAQLWPSQGWLRPVVLRGHAHTPSLGLQRWSWMGFWRGALVLSSLAGSLFPSLSCCPGWRAESGGV